MYPGPNVLQMDVVPGDPHAYPTLDVRIVSSVVSMDGNDVVQSHTVLYDKRLQDCYIRIPMVRFVHVSACAGNNVLWGQLHRFARLCTSKDHFVQQSADCITALMARGHHPRCLHKLYHCCLLGSLYMFGCSQP